MAQTRELIEGGVIKADEASECFFSLVVLARIRIEVFEYRLNERGVPGADCVISDDVEITLYRRARTRSPNELSNRRADFVQCASKRLVDFGFAPQEPDFVWR